MNQKENLKLFQSNQFSVEIFGLGYVGFPLAIRLAKFGLKVKGIDINPQRLERLLSNDLYESELNLKEEFLQSKKNGNLEISQSSVKTNFPKIGIICVPTPIPNEKTKSIKYVKTAVENFLDSANKGDIIILESSIEVGTTEEIEKIILSKGFKVGEDLGLCFCPERIDPANKEWGIENIPRVIFCSDDFSYDICKIIYKNVNGGNLVRVSSSRVAEVVKSFENAFRLVNISLVNELAILCDNLGISAKEVIDAAASKPFGFLPHYPGAGAGGHCIPKDPRFLLESAKKHEVNFETIHNALRINSGMPQYIVNSIVKDLEKMNLDKTILVSGLSYKANVEDMRDSASFKIISELEKRNCKVSAYDPFFNFEFLDKYLIENNLEEFDIEVLTDVNKENIKKFSCLCIVQHHDISKQKIQEIYEKSLIPYIYDCQNKLKKNNLSKTLIEGLGF